MIEVGSYGVSTSGLTESLCDGLANRLFSDVEQYEKAFMQRGSIYHHYESIDAFFAAEIECAYGSPMSFEKVSAKKAASHLVGKFLEIFLVDYEAMGVAKNQKKILPDDLKGLSVIDERLAVRVLNLDKKKPTRSELSILPLLYTRHAVSRITYRFKPANLWLDLVYLAVCINVLGLTRMTEDGDECWIPISNIGSFLLRRDKSNLDCLHVITFVDYDKLTVQQREDGDALLAQFSQNQPEQYTALVTLVTSMAEHRATEYIKFPKIRF